eukprot:gene5623-9440_t
MSSIGSVLFNASTKTFTPVFGVEHAYVLISAIIIWIVFMYLGGRVANARKRYGIKVPTPYESPNDKGDTKTDFNKYQRGHMNLAENLAALYMLLFSVGIFYPTYAAVHGVFLAVARVIYGIGYVSTPPKFVYGAILTHLYEFSMVGALGYAVYQMITLAL